MAKRMWAYSRMFELEGPMKTLTPLISGDISYLYQLKSEADTIIRILELGKAPMATIDNQMDLMKQKLSNILLVSQDDLYEILVLIDRLIASKKPDQKKEILKMLKKYLTAIINVNTIQQLNNINYNPPRREFLPAQLKYAQILREPYNVIVSPLEKFNI